MGLSILHDLDLNVGDRPEHRGANSLRATDRGRHRGQQLLNRDQTLSNLGSEHPILHARRLGRDRAQLVA